MEPHEDDDYCINGAHGTIAPQDDEACYDDRSDADDDIEKGRLKFNNKIMAGRKNLRCCVAFMMSWLR